MKRYLLLTSPEAAQEIKHVFNKWGIHSIHVVTLLQIEKVKGMEYLGVEIQEKLLPFQRSQEDIDVIIKSRIRP